MKTNGLPLKPLFVAKSELPPPAPTVQLPIVAIPNESVVAVSPVMLPPPLRMLNVTTTSRTGAPLAAETLTAGRIGTADSAGTVCPSPAKIAIVVGVGWGAGGAGGAGGEAGGADGGGDGGAGGGAAGGAGWVAVAEKVTEDPLAIDAVTELVPATLPRVHLSADAIPDASVVAVAGAIDPPPDATANVTVAPATANPPASVTFTDGATATAELVSAVWPLPVTMEMFAGEPGVTLTVVEPAMPSIVALIIAEPGDFACATPVNASI